MIKFLGNWAYKVSLEKTLGGWELSKFTYVALFENWHI